MYEQLHIPIAAQRDYSNKMANEIQYIAPYVTQ